MRKTITTLVDDVDGTDAAETIRFAWDGTAYEIDLSEKNASVFRSALAPYAARARTAGRPGRTRSTLPSAGSSRNAEIRAWAAANGHTVTERGRIPVKVIQAFDAAN